MPEYLVKFVARSGAASRRGAAERIKSGRVTVNGIVTADPAVKIDPEHDVVLCDGRRLHAPDDGEKVYIMLHKPRGYTTSHSDAHADKLAVELIGLAVAGKLVSAGRLDRDSEGLLIFSNDGDFIHRLAHPRYALRKCYLATADRPLSPAARRRMLDGISDGGETLRADEVSPGPSPDTWRIVLHEGKKREVRRLLKSCGAETLRLVRLSLGPVKLGDLAPGKWRHLTRQELSALLQPAENA